MKIAVCIPCHRDPAYRFCVSLFALVAHTVKAEPSITLSPLWTHGLPHVIARNELIKTALETGARYALCLDSDHIFPADSLLRLLSHGLPLVGVNYASRRRPGRNQPHVPMAARIKDGKPEPVWTTPGDAAAGKVEPVDRMGFGMVLIDLEAMDAALKAHAASTGEPYWPLFGFIADSDPLRPVGEDYAFFAKLARAGITAQVDHGLSWQIGHLSERAVFLSDTIAAAGAKAE